MRDLACLCVVAAVGAGCVHPKTRLDRPPVADWSPIETPLATGVTADNFYLATVQVMVERGYDLQLDHAAARTIVSEWIDSQPPVLTETEQSGQGGRAPAARKSTVGVAQVAFVVTVQASAVRIDIRCRERVPVEIGLVPTAFDRCPTSARPPAAIKTAKGLIGDATARAPLLGPTAPGP